MKKEIRPLQIATALLLIAAYLSFAFVSVSPSKAQATPQVSRYVQLLRDIHKELVEINTTDSVGNTTQAAEAMAARLKAAGFPAADVQVLTPPDNARKGNLVARLHGTGKQRPILLLAHLDVVEARKADWSPELDPFKLIERDNYFYGRGSVDDKAMAAIFVANLIRYKEENFKPERDIIVALTADEEGGGFNGASWLLKNQHALIDAEFGLNEGGGGRERNGQPLFQGVQASEKMSQSFRLEVKNKGGHSSVPVKDNAIYHLAAGLSNLAKFDFPVNLNEITRAYFERMAGVEHGQTGTDMKAILQPQPDPAAVARLAATAFYNAMLRTTCVATRLEGGHANNALPQTASAVVNCRILPQETPAYVQETLVRVIADEQIAITPLGGERSKASPPSPLSQQVLAPVATITQAMWPGVPVVPMMSTGATDSLYFRQAGIHMYGISGLFTDIDDIRTHGKDERIGVKQLSDGQEFLYRLVKMFASTT